MKKKIAVFANGWGAEYLKEIVSGLLEVAEENKCDLFAFVDFSVFAEKDVRLNMGEFNIFRLPDLRDFDGAILMANSFNMKEEVEYVSEKIKESGIPAVSIEYSVDGIAEINTDNYQGMYELAKHMVEVHGKREFVYIGGPKDHLESNIRLKAIEDVAAEHGLAIKPENILHGDWAKNSGKVLVKEWYAKNKKMADVFFCANDVMAMGACESIMELGFRVPEDVAVTGYDCTKLGQEFEPMIASVNHEWIPMGKRALEKLLELIDGKEVETFEKMKTRFVQARSCGCQWDYHDMRDGRGYRPHKYEGSLCDSHFRHIYIAVRKVATSEDLHKSLVKLFETENWMEGEDFMLCLEPEFFHVVEGDSNLKMEGYSEQLDVICSLKDGKARPQGMMNYKEAMFQQANDREKPGVYIYVPIHGEGMTYGFAVITSGVDIVEDNYLYSWTRHLNQYLEQVRRNITIEDLTRQLTELSVTDSLTGVYNRAGCEKIAYPMLRKWLSQGGEGVIFITDIDRMKNVNDQFGHAGGDAALRIVANALKSKVPDHWVVSRFGGDEFFIGGKILEEVDLDVLKREIAEEIKQECHRQELPFVVGVSIGYIRLKPGDENDLEGRLQKADHFMYDMKQIHHEEMDQ